jgi:hypothetical protein
LLTFVITSFAEKPIVTTVSLQFGCRRGISDRFLVKN